MVVCNDRKLKLLVVEITKMSVKICHQNYYFIGKILFQLIVINDELVYGCLTIAGFLGRIGPPVDDW